MRRKILQIGTVLMIFSLMFATFASAQDNEPPPDEDIQTAIEEGLEWLVGQQNDDGSWGDIWQTAHTCLALVKLQERAYELEYKSPFDPEYAYSDNVLNGWGYIFDGHAHETEDGIYFNGDRYVYTTGICMMALAASGTPNREIFDFNGDGDLETFLEIAQETVDWLAFAQGAPGGWGYDANTDWPDNSHSGYVVLGLAYGEDFGCAVPDDVKTGLNDWINYIQCQDDVNYPNGVGGSGYASPCSWVNELKTGNLIFEMTYSGVNNGDQRFQDALAYIERLWKDELNDPGWGYRQDPAEYQAMYTLMKGFEFSNIDLIDLDGDDTPEWDWFAEFATVLVNQQYDDGSWSGDCSWHGWSNPVLCTTWALLTLEKIAPPPPVIEVPVDIKPTSCRNPLNVKEKGVLPVAILGTEDFDVNQIDPASVLLFADPDVEPILGVFPLRWSYEDVATPFEPYTGKQYAFDCTTDGPDGYLDLTLKFNAQEVVTMLGAVNDGDVLVLYLGGKLMEEYSGTDIIGEDVFVILKKGN